MTQSPAGKGSWLIRPIRLGRLVRRQVLARAGRVAVGLPQLWALVSLAGIFIFLALWLIRPHDFWWHVRAGQWIVENGRIPKADLFSYTRAGEPWAYQSWLMEVVFYLLFSAGGLPLVIFFHAVVITAAYALLLRVNQPASGGDLRWAALTTLAAAAVGVASWNPRPQTVSFLLFALTLYIIQRHSVVRPAGPLASSLQPAARSQLGGDRLLWWLPPLFAFWANAHGGFVFGLALLGAYLLARLVAWVRRQDRFPAKLLLASGLSAAAILLTPLGLGMVDYVLGFFRHPVTQSLNMEFLPPTVRTLDGRLFFGFLAIWIALLFVGGYRPTLHESVGLLLFGLLALMARRNVAWFGFVAAPTMAASLRCWASRREAARGVRQGRPGVNRALTALVGLLALLSLPWLRPFLPVPAWRRAFVSPETAVQAVAFLRDLPQPRRVFHGVGYGSYMIWASPEVPVFIDTRVELYPLAQWEDYIALSQARYDWEAILNEYGVDTLLLHRELQEPLIEAATADPDWEYCYQDEQAMILRRAGGP